MTKKWIQSAIKNKGALRRTLKLKKNQKLTASKLSKVIKSKKASAKTKRRARLALTLLKLRRKRR